AQQGGRAVQETEAEGAVALADPDMEQVLEVFPGDLLGEYQEQYLYAQSNSHAETETPHTASWPSGQWTPHPYSTKRWADGNGTFTYRLPVSSSAPAPLLLTMITKGEMVITADGVQILNTGNSGEGGYTAREFTLSDPTLWLDGRIDLKFADADPSDGWGP